MNRLNWTAIALCAAVFGCEQTGGGPGADAGSPLDAAVSPDLTVRPDLAAPPDLTPPGPSDVLGHTIDRHYTESGVTMVPVDLTKTAFAALVPGAQPGAFTSIAGTGKADGSFTVPLVPPGAFYLNTGTTYVVTSSH